MRLGLLRILFVSVLAAWLTGCGSTVGPEDSSPGTSGSDHAGGATTLFLATSQAFSQPAPNLDHDAVRRHLQGDAAFEATFVTPPASVHGGLGPRYNRTACADCHAADGRAPDSILLRVSLPGADAHGGPLSVPGFGTQLQTRAVAGLAPEGSIAVSWEELPGEYADGQPYALRRPHFQIATPYASLPAGLMISPRMARPVFGLGLLEAVPVDEILSAEDPQDSDDDGISGRANWVWDLSEGRLRLGRFGWKANQPSLLQQAAVAYANDMGVTSELLPHDEVDDTGGGELDDDPEIDRDTLEAVAFYCQTLAVPAARGRGDPSVERGRSLFAEIGCAGCHRPRLVTASLADVPAVAGQVIWPYTDLLLHDMGADLADGRPDSQAGPTEWRTPPLWGLGLTELVDGTVRLLHDGRARNIEEAVLWHGGEAGAARDRFCALPAKQRRALLAFLHAL